MALFNLKNIEPREVTLCKSPAVGDNAKFKLLKSQLPEGKELVAKDVSFKKTDEVKKQVFGYVLVPDVADLQGDIVTVDEVEKACHSFMKAIAYDAQQGDTGTGLEHETFEGIGYPIECCVDKSGTMGGIAGGWWLGTQVTNEEVWKSVESGEITGYSMGGFGQREAFMQKKIEDKQSLLTKALEAIKKALSLEDSKKETVKSIEEKEKKKELNKEELTKAIAESVAPLQKQIEDLVIKMAEVPKTEEVVAKAVEAVAKEAEAVSKAVEAENKDKEEVAKVEKEELKKSLQEALDPLQKSIDAMANRLEAVEKTSLGSTKIAGQEETETKKSIPEWGNVFNF